MKSSFAPRDTAMLLLLALFWGHSFLFIKTAVAVMPAAWIVTTRMVIGSALLFVIGALRRDRMPRDLATLGKLGIIGVVGSSVPWAAQAWAQRSLDSGLVAVLNAFTPLATLGIAVLIGQERLQKHRVLGIAIAITGTLIVVGGEVGAGSAPLPLLVAVLATIGYALAGVLTRAHVSGRVANVPAAALQLSVGGAVLAPLAWAAHGPPPTVLPPLVVVSLLALGVLGTGISFVLYFSLIERVGATNTSMVTYLVPIVAMAAGYVYRGERFGPNVFVGALALIFGVWLAQRSGEIAPVGREA